MQYPRVKLGDIYEIVGGGTPSIHKDDYYGGNIPWATVRDMNCKVISSTERTITDKGLKESASNIIPAGNLIIATRVGLGKVCYISQDTAINQDLKGLIPKSSKICKDFTYYWLLAASDYIISNGIGATVKGVKLGFITNLKIPLPPLCVQQEIVARLEKELAKVDEMAESFKRMAELADEEFKSVLSEIFEHLEGKKVKLGDIADVYDGDHQPPPQVEKGIPFLVISNVADGRLNFENTRKVPRQYYDSLSLNRKPQLNDLLLTVTGSYGIPVKVDVKREFCFQRHIALIRTTKLQLDFLFYFMKSKKSQQYFDKVATGTAQKTVSLSALRNMLIIYPKDEIQLSISKYADSAYKNYLLKKDYIYKGISLCSELRKSILQEAFS